MKLLDIAQSHRSFGNKKDEERKEGRDMAAEDVERQWGPRIPMQRWTDQLTPLLSHVEGGQMRVPLRHITMEYSR